MHAQFWTQLGMRHSPRRLKNGPTEVLEIGIQLKPLAQQL